MWYVEVMVADAAYRKDSPLTYGSPQKLDPGRIVVVPLQRKQVMGFVSNLVSKPNFEVRNIIDAPELPPLPNQLRELRSWMQSYYPAPSGVTTQLILPDILPKKIIEAGVMRPAKLSTTSQPKLTQEQKRALRQIGTQNGLHLLHGETGSGKTRIYLELAVDRFKRGESSIILTPEIGLTSQLVNTFAEVFGDRVITVHSNLTDSVRKQTWQWLLTQKEPVVVIGARSALFSPVAKIGLIVVDEAHETSYKQDQAPYYHTSPVAAKLASLHKATLVLGSATPLVSDYFVAKAKGRPIITMNQLAVNSPHKSVIHTVDLKDRGQFRKSPYLSSALLKSVEERLQNHEQALLFLNRRGTARVVFCEKCGWQANCPKCDLPLVYHHDHYAVRCHSCGYKTSTPTSCPDCKSPEVIFRSIGTKAIADEIKRLFPESKVMRFDTDNKKSERLESHYESLRNGEIDIIIGTQTLAKGLDLPKLGLVGVVIADTSLYFPDFSAQERTYQLLSQVAGRVGRGHRQGTTIIQTYAPDSPLLKAILSKDWATFYNNELEERRRFYFPPFCYLLKLTCKRASSTAAQKAAAALANKLNSHNNNVIVEGPAPAFHEKVKNKFVWQIIVKAKKREQILSIVEQLPSGWSYDIDPMNLL